MEPSVMEGGGGISPGGKLAKDDFRKGFPIPGSVRSSYEGGGSEGGGGGGSSEKPWD